MQFSACNKADGKPAGKPWGSKVPLGQQVSEFGGRDTGGWVQGAGFSVGQGRLAWVSHNSTQSVTDASEGVQFSTLKRQFQPLPSVLSVTTNSVVAADRHPCQMLSNYDGCSCSTFVSKLDLPKQRIQSHTSATGHFCNMDKRA